MHACPPAGADTRLQLLKDRTFPRMHLDLQRLLQAIAHAEVVLPKLADRLVTRDWLHHHHHQQQQQQQQHPAEGPAPEHGRTRTQVPAFPAGGAGACPGAQQPSAGALAAAPGGGSGAPSARLPAGGHLAASAPLHHVPAVTGGAAAEVAAPAAVASAAGAPTVGAAGSVPGPGPVAAAGEIGAAAGACVGVSTSVGVSASAAASVTAVFDSHMATLRRLKENVGFLASRITALQVSRGEGREGGRVATRQAGRQAGS